MEICEICNKEISKPNPYNHKKLCLECALESLEKALEYFRQKGADIDDKREDE